MRLNSMYPFRIHNYKYGTFPLIGHNPFVDLYSCRLWNTIQSYANPRSHCDVPDDLTIVTWNNTNKKGCFELQLDTLGMNYLCLGQNLKWTTNQLKPLTLKQEIPHIKTKYVLCADSFDVLILDDLHDLIARFSKFDTGVLFNATCCVFPYLNNHRQIEQELCPEPPFQFFNSGLFVGETQFVASLLEALPFDDPEFRNSDQYLFRQVYHKWYPDIQIDWCCEMFQIMYLPENVWSGKTIENCVQLEPKYKVIL